MNKVNKKLNFVKLKEIYQKYKNRYENDNKTRLTPQNEQSTWYDTVDTRNLTLKDGSNNCENSLIKQKNTLSKSKKEIYASLVDKTILSLIQLRNIIESDIKQKEKQINKCYKSVNKKQNKKRDSMNKSDENIINTNQSINLSLDKYKKIKSNKQIIIYNNLKKKKFPNSFKHFKIKKHNLTFYKASKNINIK